MKKIMSKFMLILVLTSVTISQFNINAYSDTQLEAIKSAIKVSRPKLLKEALNNVKLTEQDKNVLLSMAASISQVRQTNMNMQLIKPKPKRCTKGEDALVLGSILLVSTATANLFILEGFLSDKGCKWWDESFDKPIAIALTIGAFGLFFSSGSKDAEAEDKYRTPKQKYIDSLDILAMLKSN